MSYDPATHHRRSLRLRDYDYHQAGAYFVTLCTVNKAPIFGGVAKDAMCPNAYGVIVADDWLWLARNFAGIELDAFVIMPNHLHGVIVAQDGPEGGSRTAPTHILNGGGASVARPKSLGRLIGAFKTVSTKHVNEWRETPGATLWQRDFYEHIIRNDADLERIRVYITANPAKWSEDREYAPTVP